MATVVDQNPLQKLEALERSHDLFAFRVDGWSAWRVIRFPVHTRMLGLPLASPTRSNLVRSLEALRATMKFAWLLLTAGRRELLIKTYRSALRLPQGDRFRDVYFDGLIETGCSYLKLEVVNTGDFDRQAAAALRPPDLDAVVFTFWGRVLSKLFPVRAGEFCNEVAGLLAREAGVALSPAWLLLQISTVYWQARLYGLLLARIRPRVALVADTADFALRIATQRRGTRFIELQHGVFGPEHPDVLPTWVPGSAAELLLPDVLACYGLYWTEKLAETRQAELAAVVGNELIDLARQRRSGETGALHLVLTSQGLDSVRLAEWIAAMIAAAPVGLAWRLSIKLHPAYDSGTRAFDALKADSRVTVIGGADQPNVFELLADADLHLSIASACHFDAAALGVRSIVVPLTGYELMLSAVDGSQFVVAPEPAAVWRFAQPRTRDPAGMYRFATPGFVDNLQKLLQR